MMPDNKIATLCQQELVKHSHFLSCFLEKEQAFLQEHNQKGWYDVFNILLDEIKNIPCEIAHSKQLSHHLRIKKYRAQCVLGLAELYGNTKAQDIWLCHSKLADALVSVALQYMVNHVAHDGFLLSAKEHGFFILALGKWGGEELNFSSDIDGIIFVDLRCIVPDKLAKFNERINKYGRLFLQLLNEYTIDGYVFRTDLRLRPDPAATALIINTDMAVNYYQSHGETWERAALSKGRFCAGNGVVSTMFLKEITAFIFRRYLDYIALEQIGKLRWRIIKETQQKKQKGIFIKTDKGGIRSIEFIVQGLQLVWGGRHKNIQNPNTLQALQLLHEQHLIQKEDYSFLYSHYIFLRKIEHALQMLDDKQTQLLPADDAIIAAIAAMISYNSDGSNLYEHLCAQMQKMHDLELLIFPYHAKEEAMGLFHDTIASPETLQLLKKWHVIEAETIYAIFHKWFTGQHKVFTKENAQALLPDFYNALCLFLEANTLYDADAHIIFMDKFLLKQSYPTQFLSLIKHYPALLQTIMNIHITSPIIAEYLLQNPYLVDNIIDMHNDSTYIEQAAVLLKNKCQTNIELDEAFLIDVRKNVNDIKFSIASDFFNNGHQILYYQKCYANLATIVVAIAVDYVCKQLQVCKDDLHFSIVSFGNLASQKLFHDSDLDLVFVYDTKEGGQDEVVFYTKFIARFTTFMEAQMAYGFLYKCDFRLRPSGNDGPLAVSWQRYNQYYGGAEAWSWEKLALSRARIIYTSDVALKEKIQKCHHTILQNSLAHHAYTHDINEMRTKIQAQKKGKFSLKTMQGGMMDVDFLIEYFTILLTPSTPNILSVPYIERIKCAYEQAIISYDDYISLQDILLFYNEILFISKITYGEDTLYKDEKLQYIIYKKLQLPSMQHYSNAIEEKQKIIMALCTKYFCNHT